MKIVYVTFEIPDNDFIYDFYTVEGDLAGFRKEIEAEGYKNVIISIENKDEGLHS